MEPGSRHRHTHAHAHAHAHALTHAHVHAHAQTTPTPTLTTTPKHVRTHTRETKAQQDREWIYDTCLQWKPTGETIATALTFGVGICFAGALPGKRKREEAYTRERERTSKQVSQWERMKQRSHASKRE